jgi:hypothetical protein
MDIQHDNESGPAGALSGQRRGGRWVDPAVWARADMVAALAARDVAAVYRILQRFGVSQQRIAYRTGQSQSEISEILAGRRVVSYDVLAGSQMGSGCPAKDWVSSIRS